jgi:hypothetical protein
MHPWLVLLAVVNFIESFGIGSVAGYLWYWFITISHCNNVPSPTPSGDAGSSSGAESFLNHQSSKAFSFEQCSYGKWFLLGLAGYFTFMTLGLWLAVGALRCLNRCVICLYQLFGWITVIACTFIAYCLAAYAHNVSIGPKILIYGITIINWVTLLTTLTTCCACREDVDEPDTVMIYSTSYQPYPVQSYNYNESSPLNAKAV